METTTYGPIADEAFGYTCGRCGQQVNVMGRAIDGTLHPGRSCEPVIERRHVAAEGDGATNDHPDGCYHCGSPHHHSTDCKDRD